MATYETKLKCLNFLVTDILAIFKSATFYPTIGISSGALSVGPRSTVYVPRVS